MFPTWHCSRPCFFLYLLLFSRFYTFWPEHSYQLTMILLQIFQHRRTHCQWVAITETDWTAREQKWVKKASLNCRLSCQQQQQQKHKKYLLNRTGLLSDQDTRLRLVVSVRLVEVHLTKKTKAYGIYNKKITISDN